MQLLAATAPTSAAVISVVPWTQLIAHQWGDATEVARQGTGLEKVPAAASHTREDRAGEQRGGGGRCIPHLFQTTK